eukprot:GHUV01013143.1.p1 GENE.GHUV01013143.1~~GHUV01013143.1.p1  ORF type:complete len:226 (+),score=72.97 GHUV01013143.1:300-977(+)
MFAINKPHARVGNSREQSSTGLQRVPGRQSTAIRHVVATPNSEAAERTQQAVRQLVQQRGLDVDAGLVAQEAVSTFGYLDQTSSLPEHVWDPSDLVARALQLSDLLATGSTFRTLQMLKRHPQLLELPSDEVAVQVLQLKMLMPAANIAELLYQKPTLLLLPDIPAVLVPALNKLHALMPGIPVEKKLHEGGTVFWSFVSLLEASSSNAAAEAGATAVQAEHASS